MFSEIKIQRTIEDNLFPPFFHASEEKKEDEEKEDSEEKETCVSCASKSVTECGAFFCLTEPRPLKAREGSREETHYTGDDEDQEESTSIFRCLGFQFRLTDVAAAIAFHDVAIVA